MSGKEWSRRFTLIETEMVNAGKLPDFDQVNAELERRGVKRREPTQIGLNITRSGGASPANGGVHKEKQQQDPRRARGPQTDAHSRANAGPVEKAHSPAKAQPPVGSPPAMKSPAQDTWSGPGVLRKDGPKSDGLRNADAAPSGADPIAHTKPAEKSSDEGLPWYVPFGLVMLAVCLGVGLYARAKAA